ncbi:MAG: hypothetical protein ACLQU2_27940 [Candidatus Binataceae bacterium]
MQAIIDLPHPDIPYGAALDEMNGIVFVASTAGIDLVFEGTNTLISGSPFALPLGSTTPIFTFDPIVFDRVRRQALMLVADGATCPSFGQCSGLVSFNESTHTFGSVIEMPSDTFGGFAFNFNTDVAMNNTSQGKGAIDVFHHVACDLNDRNFSALPDGAQNPSFDPSTNLVLYGTVEVGGVALLNMTGATFSGTTYPCMLKEGGVPPNSILLDGVNSGALALAIDPSNHLAFLSEDDDITLIKLPTAPVPQLASSMVSAVNSDVPDDPNNVDWQTTTGGAVAASCSHGNFGYLVTNSFGFLAQVDLDAFAADPLALRTSLPTGNCSGTSTILSCSNGHGIVYFPLPD